MSIDGHHFEDDDDDDSDDSVEIPTSIPLNASESFVKLRPSREEPNLMDLHPRALVGCIRVDSQFSPSNVANVMVALDLRHISLSLRHDRSPDTTVNGRMPSSISQYSLNKANTTRVWHTFLKLYQRNFRAQASLMDDDQTLVQIETTASASILDFAYLTMLPLLDECTVKLGIDLRKSQTTANVVTDVIRLHYGQAVGQTMTICQQLWKEHECREMILATRYIVCNCTSSPIKYGQVNTDETLFLNSNESTFYAFRSLHADQHLRLSLETISWTGQEPICVSHTDGMQVMQLLEPDQLAIAQLQKISASHVVVTIKGQVEFRNMSDMAFRVQYRVTSSQTDAASNVEAVEMVVEGMSAMSLVTRCDEAITQTIK